MTLEQWRQDLSFACRGLLRVKAFTGTAVATLAVGIAGVTVMFALIEGVLLRPLPVQEQDRLLVAWKELRSAGFAHYPFRAAEIDVLNRESQLLDSAAGVDYNGAWPFVAVENESATLVQCVSVVGDFFGVLGIDPFLGRALTRGDDVIGAENVLVISHGLWRRRYGGAGDVVGRTVTLLERPFRIVGVMPRGFEYPHGAEAWITAAAFTSTVTDPEFEPLVDVIARLRPGATIDGATSELHALMARLEADAPPGATRGLTPVVRSYEDVVVGDVGSTMLLLFGAVTLVLVIASANVANLLLMRSEGRRRDIAVRAALGASRSRLARQLLVESVVLAVAAGAVGLAVTLWSLPALLALVPVGFPRIDSVRIDAGVIGFTMAIAFVTAALAGMAPALSSTHVDLVSHLRSGGGGIAGPAARYGRRMLVVGQVALAVAVITATGLLTRSLLQLETVDMGLDADRLVFVELSLPQAKSSDRERQRQFLDAMVAELEAAPEIAGATPVNTRPFSRPGGWDAPTFTVEGQTVERAASNGSLNLELIYPNYFSTFRVALVRGRAFTAADVESAPNVVIVSEDVAARTWPGEEAIGKRLKFGGAKLAATVADRGGRRSTDTVPRAERASRNGVRASGAVGVHAVRHHVADDLADQRLAERRAIASRPWIRQSKSCALHVSRSCSKAQCSASFQCARDWCVRRRGAIPGGDRGIRSDECRRAPARHRDWTPCRSGCDPSGCTPPHPRRRALARRTRRRDRPRGCGGGDPAAAGAAVRSASARSGVDARCSAAAGRRSNAGVLSACATSLARESRRAPEGGLSRAFRFDAGRRSMRFQTRSVT